MNRLSVYLLAGYVKVKGGWIIISLAFSLLSECCCRTLLLIGGTHCRRSSAAGRTLPALARSVFAAPMVGVVSRLEQLLVVATVRHSCVEVARPLPVAININQGPIETGKNEILCVFFTLTESLLAQSVQVAQVFGPERALKCQTLLRVSLGNLQSVQCLRTCWHHHSCPQRFVPHMTCPEISQENGREFNRSK